MQHSENSLQSTIKDGVFVTSASRNEALAYLVDLHNLLTVLPTKWHNTQITSKGVYIRVKLSSNAFCRGYGKTFEKALLDFKTKLIKKGIIHLLPMA